MRPSLLDLIDAYHSGRTDFPLSRLPTARIDWALECGLAPVIARCCADDPGSASHPRWETILGSDLAARVVAEDHAQAAVEIIEACAPRVGTLALLKGIWLSHALHAEPHLRPMRDLDLLLPDREAAREAEPILIGLGYEPTKAAHEFGESNHLVPYRHPGTGVLVELHHALFTGEGPPGSDPFAGSTVRDHLRPAEFRGHPVLRLSNELQMAYLAAHWTGSEDVVGGAGSLIVMLDLPLLAKDVDWNAVVDLLTSPVSASAMLLILSYLEARGLVRTDPWLLPAIWQRQRVFGRANLALVEAMIDRWLVDGHPFGRLLTTPRNLGIVWMGLLNPRPALVNLLSLPWALLPLGWRRRATPLARPLARAVGVELRELDPPR